MIKRLIYFSTIIASVLFAMACNLEKEINVNLPEDESQLVVECYLEPGKPYRVLVTETVPFTFISEDPNNLPFVNHAQVIIIRDGIRDTLTQNAFVDFQNFKIYNYGSNTVVVNDFASLYEIEVRDTLGRMAFSNTKLLPIVPIDSMEYNFNDADTSALVLTWFTDPPEKNYYRRVLHLNSLQKEPEQAFAVDDAIFNGDDVVFGTGFDFTYNDTLIATLYSIDKAYYDFLETVEAADAANVNPFAQPSFILDNIEGGIGIFTGLSYYRDTLIIE